MISETWTRRAGEEPVPQPARRIHYVPGRTARRGNEGTRMQVEYQTYRFPIDNFGVVFSRLNTVR